MTAPGPPLRDLSLFAKIFLAVIVLTVLALCVPVGMWASSYIADLWAWGISRW